MYIFFNINHLNLDFSQKKTVTLQTIFALANVCLKKGKKILLNDTTITYRLQHC